MNVSIFALAASAIVAAAPFHAHAENLQGYWSGTIANSLNVTLHLQPAANGQWEGTMHVPAQSLAIKVDDLVVAPGQLSFAIKKFNASFSAQWKPDQQAWAGTWTQGTSTALILKRSDVSATLVPKVKRPQEDAIAARPANYSVTELTFDNPAAKVTLAATLTVPHGKGPFPAVVLVHGSGPVDRNETVFQHKPFLILANHLSRQGIAVLRYDKRGVGKSSGAFKDATTADFASDAEAALRFLRSRPDVDSGKIGVIGHSEGGLIAPLLASRDPALGFAVVLAGPGVRGELIMVEQLALMAKENGASEAAVEKDRAVNQAFFSAIASEPDLAAAGIKAAKVLDEAERAGAIPAGSAQILLRRYGTPWFHHFLRYDPAPALAAMRQPILVLNGELDLQVPPALAVAPISAALKANPRAVVKVLPKLNHLLQSASTGDASEYKAIEETMSPLALNAISEWIRATVK